MFSSALFAALVAMGSSLSASAAGLSEIQSLNPTFGNAGIQGCMSVAENADGEPLIVHNCNSESLTNQGWNATFYGRTSTDPEQIRVFGNKCIDVKDGVNADGTKLQIWTCTAGNKNQLWISETDDTFRWAGTNKCIDLTDGKITDGNVLQIYTCDSKNSNQKWRGRPNPDTTEPAYIKLNSAFEDYCFAAASDTDGAEVAIVGCLTNPNSNYLKTFPNGQIAWNVPVAPLTGQIKIFNNKCLDVPNGSTANGVKLQIWTCAAGNTNQVFEVHPAHGQIEWSGKGKCLDLPSGNTTNGNRIQLWDCAVPDNNPNQDWNTFEIVQ
ncbi:hypothetical protein MVEN_00305700 [Mycena venus]|uniref:Ricin B lectin domain-containing protein n=1 Tax=Mycena venus TaxID=2733690 RepID=A0A8H6Z5P6_9AGAR|nr:hypothetical protein MVEN_00305700 [Mycena venus]